MTRADIDVLGDWIATKPASRSTVRVVVDT
jgi:hypothetical protein